jgi:phosphate transport system ATP-binding protein
VTIPNASTDSPGALDDRVTAIEVRDLSVSYGRQPALKDVNLTIESGLVTAIIGPSGCGKTTFLSVLNRLTDLVPGCRVDGAVSVGGTDVLERRCDVVRLRQRVGMIFQKPNPFPVSIRRNLDLPLREAGVRDRARRDAVMQRALTDVGLWDEVADRLERAATELSGGQQQRLCLARALVLQPKVLLLDEPCSALDPISTGVVENLIRRLGERRTIVIVTHNLGQARRLADRVAFFWSEGDGGRVIECGSAERIFDSPEHDLTAAYVSGRVG